MYTNKSVTEEVFLDGDEEADRKTVEWLRKALERKEQERSGNPVAS